MLARLQALLALVGLPAPARLEALVGPLVPVELLAVAGQLELAELLALVGLLAVVGAEFRRGPVGCRGPHQRWCCRAPSPRPCMTPLARRW